MKKYKAQLSSDTGKHWLTVFATDENAAIKIITLTQLCPERAILKIKQ